MSTRRLYSIPLILVILTGCEALLTGPLEITAWMPQKSITAAGEAELSVTFSSEPEKLKSEEAFSITKNGAELPGVIKWCGNTLKFLPYHPLPEGCDYEIHVGTDAEDIYGNSLSEDFTLRFRTYADAGRPSVLSVYPPEYSETSDPYQRIELVFDRTVEWESLLKSFSLTPEVKGFSSWNGGELTFLFQPAEQLEWQKTYTISLSTSLKAEGGSCLSNEFSSLFKHGTDENPPNLLSLGSVDSSRILLPSPADNPILETNSEWEKDAGLRLVFSEEISEDSAEAAFSIEPAVPFTIEWDHGKVPPEMIVKWDEALGWLSLYRILISTGLRDLQNNGLEDEAVYYLYVDGPASRPPELELVTFTPDQITRIVFYDKTDPENGTHSHRILDTSAGADAVQNDFYIDYYFTLADGAELPFFCLTDNYLISPTDDCIFLTYKNFQLFNPGKSLDEAAEPKPVPAGNQAVVRLISSVTDKYDSSGTIKFQVFNELTDSLGNCMSSNWSRELFDEDD